MKCDNYLCAPPKGQTNLLSDVQLHWLGADAEGGKAGAKARVNAFCRPHGIAPPRDYSSKSDVPLVAELDAYEANSPVMQYFKMAAAESRNEPFLARALGERVIQLYKDREIQGKLLLPWDWLFRAGALARLGRHTEAAAAFAKVDPKVVNITNGSTADIYRWSSILLPWLRGDKAAAFKAMQAQPGIALGKGGPRYAVLSADGSMKMRDWLSEVRKEAPPPPPEVLELNEPGKMDDVIKDALAKGTHDGARLAIEKLERLLEHYPPNPKAIEPMEGDEPVRRDRFLKLAEAHAILKQPAERAAVLNKYEKVLTEIMDQAKLNGLDHDRKLWSTVANFMEVKGDRDECMAAWRTCLSARRDNVQHAIAAALRMGDRAAADEFYRGDLEDGNQSLADFASYAWFKWTDDPEEALEIWQRCEREWQSADRWLHFRPSSYSDVQARSSLLPSSRWSWLLGLALYAREQHNDIEAERIFREAAEVWPMLAADYDDQPQQSFEGIYGASDLVASTVVALRKSLPPDVVNAARARAFAIENKYDEGLAMLAHPALSPVQQTARAELLTLARRWPEAGQAWLGIADVHGIKGPQRENMLLCAMGMCGSNDVVGARQLRDRALLVDSHSRAEIVLQAWLALDLAEYQHAVQLFQQAIDGKNQADPDKNAYANDPYAHLGDMEVQGLAIARWAANGRKDTIKTLLAIFEDNIESRRKAANDIGWLLKGGARTAQLGLDLITAAKLLPADELAAAYGADRVVELLAYIDREADITAWRLAHPDLNVEATARTLLGRAHRGDALRALELLRAAPAPKDEWDLRGRARIVAEAQEAVGEIDAAFDTLLALVKSEKWQPIDFEPLWRMACGLDRTAEFARALEPHLSPGKANRWAWLYACRIAWNNKRYEDVITSATRVRDIASVENDENEKDERWQAQRYQLAAVWESQGAQAAYSALANALADAGGYFSRALSTDGTLENLHASLDMLQKSWSTLPPRDLLALMAKTKITGTTLLLRSGIMLFELKHYNEAIAQYDAALKDCSDHLRPILLAEKSSCLRQMHLARLDEALQTAREAKTSDSESLFVSRQLFACLCASKLNAEALEEGIHVFRKAGSDQDLKNSALQQSVTLVGEPASKRFIDEFGNDENLPRLHLHSGCGLQIRGEHAEALSHFELALKSDALRADAENAIVTSLWLTGQRDEALQRYRALLEADASLIGNALSDDINYKTRAALYLALQERAAKDLAQWVDAAKTDPERLKLIQLLKTLECLALLVPYEDQFASNPDVLRDAVFRALDANDIAKVKSTALALASHPDAPPDMAAMAAYAITVMGDAKTGSAVMEQAFKDFGIASELLRLQAWLQWNQGDSAEALRNIIATNRLLRSRGGTGDDLGLAGILWTQGKKAEAIEAFHRACQADAGILKPDYFKNDAATQTWWTPFEVTQLSSLRDAASAKATKP